MARQRRRDTAPEIRLRAVMHAVGLRYLVDRQPDPALRWRADVVFTRARVAVFVDGCFWHGCDEHGSVPKGNRSWWARKLELNMARDVVVGQELGSRGWTVVRVWEHEDPHAATAQIQGLIERSRLAAQRPIAAHAGSGSPTTKTSLG
jgi:DNA mismatch endonuclease (patch repair protein)